MVYLRFNATGRHTVVTFTCHKSGQMFYVSMDFSMEGELNQTGKDRFIRRLLPAYSLVHLTTESIYSIYYGLKLRRYPSRQQQSP